MKSKRAKSRDFLHFFTSEKKGAMEWLMDSLLWIAIAVLLFLGASYLFKRLTG